MTGSALRISVFGSSPWPLVLKVVLELYLIQVGSGIKLTGLDIIRSDLIQVGSGPKLTGLDMVIDQIGLD
ncbi:hypothetical protein H0H92_011294, partial [Tricholoma furcatifolium]